MTNSKDPNTVSLTPLQQWRALRENPFAAAAFYRAHARDIDAERDAERAHAAALPETPKPSTPHLDEWNRRKANPFDAATYYLTNAAAIDAECVAAKGGA